ncbi:TBC1D17 [Cervus elaphus hippelaphus]|uniref:TBC1 domain family member 17 n=1 Tax=Cervus elaphus hippelaphus TaxID=46360 RepID=A0A212DE01_CEREH|nr:TBC1D17 [Cervus elaphus hippelaphus]
MEGAGYRVVFEKGGVYLHTSAKKHQDPDSLIAGVIRVVEKEEPTFDPGYEPDWAVISTVRPRPRHSESPRGAEPSSPRGSWAFSVSLGELRSIRRSKPGLSWAYLVLVTQAGGSLPALHFHRGGTRALLRVLSRYLLLASSPQDSRLYLVFPHDSSALSSSFHHLQLFDQDSSNVVSVSPRGQASGQGQCGADRAGGWAVTTPPPRPQRFLQDPYSTTFSSFSRVTNFFRGALQPHLEGASADLPPAPDDEPEPGFEVISCVELGPRPAVERAPPVAEEEWTGHVGPEGRLQRVPELKARIFSGGLSPSLRREAWKFLLGYLSWEGSTEEHKAHVRKKTDEYFRMKLQWKSVSPEQERRNSLLHGYRSLIERDVSRTDRTNKFYEGPENPGLGLLNDILLTYCMYHFDLGYVQGMSDLLSPILYVIQNEVDAFWCFCGFMERVHGNFEESQETMKRQLGQLLLLLRVLDPPLCDFLGGSFVPHGNFEESQETMKRQLGQLLLLLRVLDPPLCDFLDSQDSGSLCFCFRWLLIWFKREFPFPDVLRLWEVLWTGLPGPNLHLLVACAILDMERDTLMLSGFGSNEILKHINELTMKLSVEDVLTRAEALYRQLTACRELPHNVQEVLGLAPPAEPQSPSPPASPLPLSPTRAPPAPLPSADTATATQPDSSLEILPEEDDDEEGVDS